MLQNARRTAFPDFELLSEINSGDKYTPPRLGLNLTYNNMQHTFKQKMYILGSSKRVFYQKLSVTGPV